MFKRFLSKKISVPLAAALAIGVAVAFVPALADFTPGTYLDTQTFMISWRMARVSAGVIACEGSCRSAQAAGANPQRCRLREANQATTAACLTALATDCTPQNVINCASGEP
jgi:hypothetical protein